MGLFDTVRVERKDLKGNRFQTKSLDCTFDTYLLDDECLYLLLNGKQRKASWVDDIIEFYDIVDGRFVTYLAGIYEGNVLWLVQKEGE